MTNEITLTVNPNSVEELPLAGYGPAMMALPNDRWRRFVMACCEPTPGGEMNYTLAAEKAGVPSENRNALHVTAHRMAHDERIQAAIMEEAKRQIGGGLLLATAVLVQVASDLKAKDADRIKAAGMILRLGNMEPAQQIEHKVEKVESEGAKIERIVRLAQKLKLDPRELLGKYGYTAPAALVQSGMPDSSFAGLESIL